jgi:diguanylate cyclase (GGDEF)-like protein
MIAARRSEQAGGRSGVGARRAYPAVGIDDDRGELPAWIAATRALLRASTPEEVTDVIATFIEDLGGELVPARLADTATAIPFDISLGLSEPLLPRADPASEAAMRLAKVLPEFMEDARLVIDRLRGDVRRIDEAERDTLTGLLTRRAWMRRLSSAAAGDPICMIDLDRFKAVNDTSGHAAGDEVLRAVGALLLRTFRDKDACGRYGGDEMVCLTPGMPVTVLAQRLDAMREQWEERRPESGSAVGLSIGVAVLMHDPRAALKAADAALYRVKNSGRNRTAIATEDDYESSHDT